MRRIPRLALALMLVFAALAPAGAAPRKKSVLDRERFELRAGEFAAFRWQPKRKRFVVERVPDRGIHLSGSAEVAISVAPEWLRHDLRRAFSGLLLVPVKVAAASTGKDVDGDGEADEVTRRADGTFGFLKSRGPGKWGERPFLEFRRDARAALPGRRGSATRPAAADNRLLVGTLDGRLTLYERAPGAAGPLPWKMLERADAEAAPCDMAFASPALADLNGDGKPETVVGGECGHVHLLGDGLAGDPFEGISAGTFSAPCFGDLDGDGDLDLLCGNREGVIRLFRNVGTREAPEFRDEGQVAGIDVGESSVPAAADVTGDGKMDLVVGSQDGALHLFTGPELTEVEGAFRGLDVGELAAPAFDGNGRLLVGRLEGDLLLYELSFSDGALSFREEASWRFTPGDGGKSIAEYYDARYYPERETLLGANDTRTVEAYAELLREAPKHLRDEIAFSIAHTPVEVLRAMHRLGGAGLLLDNARAVYEMAERVSYAKIVEKGDRTTLAYAGLGDEGIEWVEAPADTYYWWVVHPRILYEIPAKIDGSYWSVSAADRGLTDSEWWNHKPEKDVHAPSPQGVFWRQGLKTDFRHDRSLIDEVGDARTLRQAIHGVDRFLAKGSDDIGLMRFGYETQDVQPWLIYKKRYGSCGEHSIVGAACARTMLIPAYVVTDRGEDHQWNEWWDVDGGWHHWDCCSSGNIDKPWGSTEGWNHQGKTVSAVTGWRGDDLLFPVTTTVTLPEGERDYTTRGSGYTDTAEVTVIVQDAQGRPLDGALVIVRSHWQERNLITIWGYTDGRGQVVFDLGYEPNGGYTFEALTPLGSAGVTNRPIEENTRATLILKTPGEKPPFTRGENVAGRSEFPEDMGDAATARIVGAELRPPNLVTARRYRIASYLTDEVGYRGTRGHRVPIDPGDMAEVIVFSPEEYENFTVGRPSKAARRTSLRRDGRLEHLPWADRDYVVVVSNREALWTVLDLEVAARPVPDVVVPKVMINGGPLTVASGGRIEVGGHVEDNIRVTDLIAEFDARPEPHEVEIHGSGKSGTFSFRLDTGAGGPVPPGTYQLRLTARDAAGNLGSAAVELTVTPARVFKDQRIRQDDKDDPLAGSPWTFGPFTLDGTDRFFLARATSTTDGFDMDMHLYRDRNGNGRIDGGESAAKSAGPTASERIFLEDPAAGTYWLVCQGFTVEGDDASLDVEVYPVGTASALVDRAPVGRLREAPTHIEAGFLPFAGIAPGSVRVMLDGTDVTGFAGVAGDGVSLGLAGLPLKVEPGVEHAVEVVAAHRGGRTERALWTFSIDRSPPRLALLSPAPGDPVEGKVEVRVRAEEEGKGLTVRLRTAGGSERRLKAVKDEPGVFAVEVDFTGFPPGESFVWLIARDRAGNETEKVLRVVVGR